jgi:hypothetical protein
MTLTSKQKKFLNEVVSGTWSINRDTGLVDVIGNVDASMMNLTEIPLNFGEVSGYFYCYINELTSLVGAPQSVGGNFYCFNNPLTSLLGAPKSVEGDIDCSCNKLNSLVGAPQSIGGMFYINLFDIDKKDYPVIIPEIEELISRGVNLHNPQDCYYPYKEIHYTNKLIELL